MVTDPLINSEVLAYLAGFVDGEGCFLYDTSPRITVSNTYLPMLCLFKTLFGGGVYWAKRGDKSSRNLFQFKIAGDQAIALGWAIAPYLKEKHDQWVCVLDMRSMPANERKELKATLKNLKRIEYTYDSC